MSPLPVITGGLAWKFLDLVWLRLTSLVTIVLLARAIASGVKLFA